MTRRLCNPRHRRSRRRPWRVRHRMCIKSKRPTEVIPTARVKPPIMARARPMMAATLPSPPSGGCSVIRASMPKRTATECGLEPRHFRRRNAIESANARTRNTRHKMYGCLRTTVCFPLIPCFRWLIPLFHCFVCWLHNGYELHPQKLASGSITDSVDELASSSPSSSAGSNAVSASASAPASFFEQFVVQCLPLVQACPSQR